MHLLDRFMSQNDTDLFMTTTASANSEPALKMFEWSKVTSRRVEQIGRSGLQTGLAKRFESQNADCYPSAGTFDHSTFLRPALNWRLQSWS